MYKVVRCHDSVIFYFKKVIRCHDSYNCSHAPVCLCISVFEPYKYAGYPMLIKTITMETSDEQLFSKTSPLLPSATELAFHTINCSALNAEELRRENGIEVQPSLTNSPTDSLSHT